jgi:hypothetical protein
MTARKTDARQAASRSVRGERIKDEVYRQMFLLEERRLGAEMNLALALVRAWLDTDSKRSSDGGRDWLRKVSPICLEMIEAALQAAGPAQPCVH